MRKIWRFSAPSKRNLGSVVLWADVRVPGLCLSDYYALDSGHLSIQQQSSTLGEGRDRRGRRKGKAQWEEGWVYVCYRSEVFTVYWRVQFLLAFVKRCHLVPSHQWTPASHARHLQHCPGVPTPQADFGSAPVGIWVPKCPVGIRHQRNQMLQKDAKPCFKEPLPLLR